MDIIKQLLNKIDGNKTAYGVVILTMLNEGLIDPSNPYYAIVSTIGMLLTGTGVGHKIVKDSKKKS